MSEEELQRIIGNIQLRLVTEKVGGIETRTKDEIVLIKCIQDLQQRINKAVEYIEEHTYDDSLDGDGSRLMFEKANGKDLLETLKGKE